ncbi:MAG: methyltransferase domain-containing protein [Chloroflexota bacterium]|nr:methyltransferase domain-containing protein [Chloroflexota bacterium]
MTNHDSPPPICDYEGSNYRTEFWEGKGRGYEDRVERIALRRLLPAHGTRLLEIGAGFGRLTDEYNGYDQVVLLDYSFSQLQHARVTWGDARCLYVAADVYHLPFHAGVFDGATMIRVLHHMADVPRALAGIRRVMTAGGTFILEHANKRNLKAIARYALKRQSWNPNDPDPVEFVALNFDFHPETVRRELIDAGFAVQRRSPVSYFRLGALKARVPAGVLAAADATLQRSGLLYAPSVFIQAMANGNPTPVLPIGAEATALFACPQCGGDLRREDDAMICTSDGARYAIRDGIYDFKAPM